MRLLFVMQARHYTLAVWQDRGVVEDMPCGSIRSRALSRGGAFAEMNRLILKGRITRATFVRKTAGNGSALRKCRVSTRRCPSPGTSSCSRDTPLFGIPVGLALLPWGRVSASVGILILMPFSAASVRLLVDIARDLKEVRSKMTTG